MSALAWEQDWWGMCQNTYGEETKQLTYARLMGLEAQTVDAKWPTYDLGGRSVLDIGGGPCSILLKCVNVQPGSCVVDPALWPKWVLDRYKAAEITYIQVAAEKFQPLAFAMRDEVWIYNVLQHVEDPERVIANARQLGRLLRLFEWVDTPPHPGHPHMITMKDLHAWLGESGGKGFAYNLQHHRIGHVYSLNLNENQCVGRAAYAVVEMA